jgi:hypothetical protein
MADHETTADELMDYEAWMAYDFEWLSTCAAVLRLPGDSPGADREVDAALNAGKPVFYSTAGIIAHFGGSHVPA